MKRMHGAAGPMRSRRPSLACIALAVVIGMGLWTSDVAASSTTTTTRATAPAPTPRSVIVKYRSEGPAALDRCAEALSRSHVPFASATRDGSDSLDRLRRTLRLGRHRALLGTRPGEPLAARRERLAARALARPGTAPERGRGAAARARRIAAAPRLADLAHVYRVAIPEDASAKAVAAALAADPHVEYAQPDHVQVLDQAAVFDDPYLSSSGSWGQPFADLWGLDRIDAPLAWPRSLGEGIVVAVVDTGLDAAHPDIADNVWAHPGEDLDGDGRAEPEDLNGIDDDGNGFVDDLTGFDFANSVDADEDGFYDGPDDVSDADPFDDVGHGTHVSGTIAAVADNGIGIAGVAPGARIMAVKGFGPSGSAPDSVLWRAVLYAAENGADVINNSWSCGTPCPENPLAEDVLAAVAALGTVVVTSAGNASTDVVYNSPERTPLVLTVGSIGFDGQVSDFSNRGWLTDVVAPGGGPQLGSGVFVARRNILSLYSSGTPDTELAFAVGDDYYRLAGTSMSAPHVAGAVALLLATRPELAPADVRRLIRMAARDEGEPGRDPLFGSGLLDLPALLDAAPVALDLVLSAPTPGSTHDPADGPLVIRGRADGLASLEVEVGAGLAARIFEPIESFGGSVVQASGSLGGGGGGDEELARWDVADVPSGPWVIRVRATTADGRVAEETTLVGIERIAPFRISDGGVDEARRPVVTGRRVYWQQEESGSDVSHDVFAGPFRAAGSGRHASPPVPIASSGADESGVAADGRDVVWRAIEEGEPRLEQCALLPWRAACRARIVAEGEAAPVEYWVRDGWLVWSALTEAGFVPVGCRIEGSGRSCREEPLLAPDAGSGWTIRSFDGRTAILQRGLAHFARCDLEAGGAPCAVTPLELVGSPFQTPFRPIHDGRVVVFEEVGSRPVRPPGCESDDDSPECRPSSVLSTRYLACAIEEASGRCEGFPISDFAPLSLAGGAAVSGRRIVWALGTPVEPTSIRFCELSPDLDACPVHRLTGHVAPATAPALDGPRLVWQDARSGPQAVWGFELPNLWVPPRGWMGPDGRFAFWAYGASGSAEELRYALGRRTDAGVVPIDFVFRPFGRRPPGRSGWGLVVGRVSPPLPDAPVRLRMRATTDDGLYTEEDLELRTPPGRGRASGSAARRGSARGAGGAGR